MIDVELLIYHCLFHCNPLFWQAANCPLVHPVSVQAVTPTEVQYLAHTRVVFYSTFYQFML